MNAVRIVVKELGCKAEGHGFEADEMNDFYQFT
jgi:hypothetical protein